VLKEAVTRRFINNRFKFKSLIRNKSPIHPKHVQGYSIITLGCHIHSIILYQFIVDKNYHKKKYIKKVKL